MDGQSADSLGLDGTETFSTIGLNDELKPGQEVTIQAENTNGLVIRFQTVCRIDTPVEVEYYQNGGILQTVLREFLSG
jgi:aconitate hydratase